MSSADPQRSLDFRRRLTLSRAAAAFEQFWPALWPVLAVIGLFLVVSLLGLWRLMPVWLHAAGLLGFTILLGMTLWRARRAFAWPDHDAGLGRLERVNALSHQPLRSLGDRLATGIESPLTRSLWRRHRERLLAAVTGLRTGAPRSDLPRRDPWALRGALVLLLVIAAVEAGSLAPQRLVQAFTFERPSAAAALPVQLTVWITPPAYTGRPPIALETAPAVEAAEDTITPGPQVVTVPEGSEVLAQLHHLQEQTAPVALSLGDQSQTFATVGERSAEAKLVIEGSGLLRIGTTAEELGSWPVLAVPDEPPTIVFAEAPRATQRGALKTLFAAADDYGLASIALLMRRPGSTRAAERLELMRPGPAALELEEASFLDLTPHPWAGLPVVLQLEALDGLEQRGESEPVEIVLPARQFDHPMARAVIEQRRRLADAPEQRDDVARALNRLGQNRVLYQDDPAVFLALRSAAQRLVQGRDMPDLGSPEARESLEEVMALLWETALHLEDGSLSLAERQLRELQEALREALAEGASDEELERLMSELEQAMEEYLEALMRQAQEQAQNQQPMPLDPNAMQVQRQDLQQMMDMMREMVRTGAREAARQMLAQLQEMLENLQVARSGQMNQGQQMLNQLQEMIQRQQGLLDQTYGMSRQPGEMGQEGQDGQQGQRGQQGQQGQGRFGQGQSGERLGRLTMDQEALRRRLGELMRGLGETGVPIPRALGEAELSMRSARDRLSEGEPGAAVDPQAQAIDQLQQGGQAMLEEMQQMYGQGQGDVAGQPFGQTPDGRDPLGRSMFNQGGADLYGERVPTELDLGKARAIMEELLRRSSQRNRPSDELDYIERLLKRF